MVTSSGCVLSVAMFGAWCGAGSFAMSAASAAFGWPATGGVSTPLLRRKPGGGGVLRARVVLRGQVPSWGRVYLASGPKWSRPTTWGPSQMDPDPKSGL